MQLAVKIGNISDTPVLRIAWQQPCRRDVIFEVFIVTGDKDPARREKILKNSGSGA
jgi:hypothetical protein